MLPFAFEVNNFFPFRETFVSPWSQSFFFNREERLCSPLLQESTVFFRFRENSFRLRFRNRFLLSRGAFMLPFAFEVNNFFRFVKLFVSPWSQSFFFNREERLCSPSLQESTTFLQLGEIAARNVSFP